MAGSLVASACSNSDNSTTPTTITTPVAPTTTMVPDDGVLRLGVLLPLTGPGADLGQSLSNGVEMAVDRVNETGGFNGRDVELVVEDEGDGSVSASRALEQLLEADVDAVIGPGSSVVALDVLVTLRRERLLTCSPSASALALDDFPDDGLFVRTVPSDSVQAGAIARAIDLTGRSSVAVLYVDDAYGLPLATALTSELDRQAASVEELVPLDLDDADYSDEAQRALDSGAQVIAVIADPTAGPRILAALLEESDEDATTPIFVNDALRGTTLGNIVSNAPVGAADRVRGIAPRAESDNPDFTAAYAERFPDSNGYLAVHANECVDLIVLAATAAGSTVSAVVAEQITEVAERGQPCRTFAECAEALNAGRNIDYEGPSGILELSSDGDPVRGLYDLFAYDVDGRERIVGTVPVGAAIPSPAL